MRLTRSLVLALIVIGINFRLVPPFEPSLDGFVNVRKESTEDFACCDSSTSSVIFTSLPLGRNFGKSSPEIITSPAGKLWIVKYLVLPQKLELLFCLADFQVEYPFVFCMYPCLFQVCSGS